MNPKIDLKKIYTAAIDAVNPKKAVESHINLKKNILSLTVNNAQKSFDLSSYDKIFVVGTGKATSLMALAVENIFGERIHKGCISVKYGYTEKLKKIDIIEASHPVPDANGIIAAKKICQILKEAGENDLVVSLISGGGSSLLPLPPENITLEEKRETTGLLLKSGASIHEINAVRKHLSMVKGGNLAKLAYPATVINLMMSDVVGDNMDVIASGLFVPDKSKFFTALGILKKYNLMEKVPNSVLEYIKSGVDGRISENPDETSPVFDKITNTIIASNIIALKSAEKKAGELGYHTVILSSLIEGDTKGAAHVHAAIAKEVLLSANPVKKPACIISGGETTVVVQGSGLGGRNMEFAMQAAVFLEGFENITAASIGTDGSDGPTDAAGAVSDGMTMKKARDKGLDINKYISNNDSYTLFKELDDLIITGPTNTNVMDLRVLLVT